MNHHKDDIPLPDDDNENREKYTDDISRLDQDFLNISTGLLLELISVSLPAVNSLSPMFLIIFLGCQLFKYEKFT